MAISCERLNHIRFRYGHTAQSYCARAYLLPCRGAVKPLSHDRAPTSFGSRSPPLRLRFPIPERSTMNTHRYSHFSTKHAQVCFQCGARYGRCDHTRQNNPNDWGNINLERRRYYSAQHKHWRTSDVETLRRLWNDLGMTSTEIGEIMGRSRASVCSAARRFGMDERPSAIGKKP